MRKRSVFLAKALAYALTASMALGVSYVPSQVVAVEAAEANEISASGFWENFSDYYPLEGNFNVTFEITNKGGNDNWNNPVIVFSTAAARATSGYKEYAVIRSDNYGWGGGTNLTVDGNDIVYENSLMFSNTDPNKKEMTDDDWKLFRETMKDATIKLNIIRSGNEFFINEKVTGANGISFTYKVTFTTEADNTINIFMLPDNSSMTINSYKDSVPYDKAYLIPENESYVKQENGKFTVNLKDLFGSDTVIESDVTFDNVGDVREFTMLCNDTVKKTEKIQLVKANPATSLKVNSPTHYKVALNESFDISALLTGDIKNEDGTDARVTGELTSAFVEDFTFDKAPVVVPDTLKAFLTVDHSYLQMQSITDNKTNTTTSSSVTIGKDDKSSGFWTEFSDYITLEKDCDMTIKFRNYGSGDHPDFPAEKDVFCNYVLVLANNERGADGYAEYAVVRSDAYGWWGNLSGVKRTANYDYDWKDWDEFITIMETADVSMNIKRTGNSVIIASEIKPVDGDKTYHYTTTLDYATTEVATITSAKRDVANKNLVSHTITPSIAGKGKVKITCGDNLQEYVTYECVNNVCKSLDYSISGNGNYTMGKIGSLGIIADGIDSDVILNDKVELADVKAVEGKEGVFTDKNGIVEIKQHSYTETAGQTKVVYEVKPLVVSSSSIQVKCGSVTKEVEINVTEAIKLPTTPTTPITPSTPDTTPGDSASDTTTGNAITTGGAITTPGGVDTKPEDTKPEDTKPEDTKPEDTKPAEDTTDKTDKEETTKPATKKNAKISSATATKGKKTVTVSGKVTKKATVKVTAAKKTLTTTADKNGKFSVKFSAKISKKIKKNAKVSIVVTKSGYKKATKTIKVK